MPIIHVYFKQNATRRHYSFILTKKIDSSYKFIDFASIEKRVRVYIHILITLDECFNLFFTVFAKREGMIAKTAKNLAH